MLNTPKWLGPSGLTPYVAAFIAALFVASIRSRPAMRAPTVGAEEVPWRGYMVYSDADADAFSRRQNDDREVVSDRSPIVGATCLLTVLVKDGASQPKPGSRVIVIRQLPIVANVVDSAGLMSRAATADEAGAASLQLTPGQYDVYVGTPDNNCAHAVTCVCQDLILPILVEPEFPSAVTLLTSRPSASLTIVWDTCDVSTSYLAPTDKVGVFMPPLGNRYLVAYDENGEVLAATPIVGCPGHLEVDCKNITEAASSQPGYFDLIHVEEGRASLVARRVRVAECASLAPTIQAMPASLSKDPVSKLQISATMRSSDGSPEDWPFSNAYVLANVQTRFGTVAKLLHSAIESVGIADAAPGYSASPMQEIEVDDGFIGTIQELPCENIATISVTAFAGCIDSWHLASRKQTAVSVFSRRTGVRRWSCDIEGMMRPLALWGESQIMLPDARGGVLRQPLEYVSSEWRGRPLELPSDIPGTGNCRLMLGATRSTVVSAAIFAADNSITPVRQAKADASAEWMECPALRPGRYTIGLATRPDGIDGIVPVVLSGDGSSQIIRIDLPQQGLKFTNIPAQSDCSLFSNVRNEWRLIWRTPLLADQLWIPPGNYYVHLTYGDQVLFSGQREVSSGASTTVAAQAVLGREVEIQTEVDTGVIALDSEVCCRHDVASSDVFVFRLVGANPLKLTLPIGCSVHSRYGAGGGPPRSVTSSMPKRLRLPLK